MQSQLIIIYSFDHFVQIFYFVNFKYDLCKFFNIVKKHNVIFRLFNLISFQKKVN